MAKLINIIGLSVLVAVLPEHITCHSWIKRMSVLFLSIGCGHVIIIILVLLWAHCVEMQRRLQNKIQKCCPLEFDKFKHLVCHVNYFRVLKRPTFGASVVKGAMELLLVRLPGRSFCACNGCNWGATGVALIGGRLLLCLFSASAFFALQKFF